MSQSTGGLDVCLLPNGSSTLLKGCYWLISVLLSSTGTDIWER